MDLFDKSNLSFPRASARISSDHAPKMLGWNVPADALKQIPEHWLAYEEPEASLHYLLGILYIAFTIFSLVGNGLVIWIFSCSKSLRTASNVFIVNLAICDFVMMAKTPIFIYNSFQRTFALGVMGCKVFGLMGALSGIGASITNSCIAYDRYKTIAKPMGGRLSMKKAFVILIVIWGYVLPWSIVPYLELWSRYVPEGYLTSCTFDYLTDTFDNRMFVGIIFTFSYIIPMSLIIYFYSQIVLHVVAHEKALKCQAKKMNVESLRSNADQNKTSVEIRIAKAAITICFLFVASWTPYSILALIGAFGDKALLTPGVTMIPACTCKFVACIDPWVYAISHPKYRLELQRRMPWLAINEKAETASSTTEVTTMVDSGATATTTT